MARAHITARLRSKADGRTISKRKAGQLRPASVPPSLVRFKLPSPA